MTQMSGQQFATFLKEEVAAQNKGLGKLSYEELGRSCGVTGRRLRQLAVSDDGNPSVLIIRLALFTLGYHVDAPEHDVLPHLRNNGSYIEELHGPNRPRAVFPKAKKTPRRKTVGAA
ncbi:hypothetical protein [Parasedimentitalea huanghaiensis]|uniref:XRE family transcriptional regulator n=1 Tax=Parasedimentitalea huanghaiensis TaxID=2682100 RepID=A0A6L6WGK1_9RHOB|nr:hypothetical protein [Zongyanglinia huanghaiensis]MVO16824.1 hypothetical protein [Zongyanglinia huanghaiensis]